MLCYFAGATRKLLIKKLPLPMTQDPTPRKTPTRRRTTAVTGSASQLAPGPVPGPVPSDTEPVIDYGLLSESLGFLLKRVQLAVFNEFIGRLAEQDIRPAQFSVLTIVARNPGLKQSQVSNALSIKRTNFVPLLDSLEARGLVKRKLAPGDRRSHALHLTPKGTILLAELERRWNEHEARIRALLGKDGHQQLFSLLDRLSALDGPALDGPALDSQTGVLADGADADDPPPAKRPRRKAT